MRINGKTNFHAFCLDVPMVGEDCQACREVYLVTIPHTTIDTSREGVPLVAPGTFTRAGLRDAILSCCNNPEYTERWMRQHPDVMPQPVQVKSMVVFREYHAPDAAGVAHAHFHVALRLGRKARFMPMKRALLSRFGLASNWSCCHTGYWSTVRYGIRATEHKPINALDPAPEAWCADGEHPPLEEAAAEPTTARALEARRVHRVQREGEQGKPEPRVEEIDVWPVIVRSGIRSGPDAPFAAQRLMQYAKSSCSPKMVAWLFKNRDKLPKLIEDVWAWEELDAFLRDAQAPRFERFLAATRWECVCEGRWIRHVMESFVLNRIDVPDLCGSVLEALKLGRSEDLPVVTLVGRHGGEGKSLFLAPLRPMYGLNHVQERPAGGNFSLLGIEGKKLAILDEWTFAAEDPPLPFQLLWLEGKPVPVRQPQNQQGVTGHALFTGSAPIFISAPEESLSGLSAEAGAAPSGTAAMLMRRLKVFFYSVPIAKPPPPRVQPCPRCFAQLVTTEARRGRAV